MYISIVVATFSIIAVAEFGDKTQLASIVLAARYMDPLPVFLGIVLAFTLVMGIGVAAGAGIKRMVPRKYLKVGSAILFIVFGALFVVSALTGTRII
jgi:putative Ca2+/H+ antiporter (TMEM165/GDT1 family)